MVNMQYASLAEGMDAPGADHTMHRFHGRPRHISIL